MSGLRRSRHAVCMVTLAHQLPWVSAFAQGLRRQGWSVAIREDYEPCDLLVKWGVRDQKVINIQRKAGGEICILERGYLGDRFKWASVSFGGELNGRAEFRGVRSEPQRFDRHFAGLIRPWDRKAGYALLIGQVPGDMSIAHADIVAWYRASAARLKQQGWQVRFRPHPVSLQRGIAYAPPAGIEPIGGTLESALAGAGVVVTFSSNAAVEAVLAGVPTVACDPGSMARAVASHRVGEALITPERSRWANELAWKQWTAEEMASGDCWAAVSAKSMVPL